MNTRWLKTLTILAIGFGVAQAEISKQQLEKIESYKGQYKVLGGSSKGCAPGLLNIVGDESERGVRIGHDIFLGPFKGAEEKASETSCHVKVDVSMEEDRMVVKTNVDKCPNKKEKENGRSTRYLIFKKDKLEYRVAETEFVCHFGKVSEVKK